LITLILQEKEVVNSAPRNRYITILKAFLQHWSEVKVTDRSKKEIQVLGQWLKENDTSFDVIVPDVVGEMKRLQAKND
jgi:hypothetical protein